MEHSIGDILLYAFHSWAYHVGELVPVSQLYSVIQSHIQEQKLTTWVWRGEGFPFLLLKMLAFAGKNTTEKL